MAITKIEIPTNHKFIRPVMFTPEWFKVSPNMVSNYDTCQEIVVWKYAKGVAAKKRSIALPRGSTVHHAVRWDLYNQFHERYRMIHQEEPGSPRDVLSLAAYDFLAGELRDIAEEHNREFTPANAEEISMLRYEYPGGYKRFGYGELLAQISTMSLSIYDYIIRNQIQPMISPHTKLPMVESELLFPLIIDGEILDETFGEPTRVKCRIDLVDSNAGIIDWKATNTKARTPNFDAETNHATVAYAAALLHHIPELAEQDEFDVRVVKAVTDKHGNPTDTFGDSTGYTLGIEEHVRTVTKDDINKLKIRYASVAKRIKEMDLHKQDSWRCNMCEYKEVCIHGKTENFQIEKFETSDDYEGSDGE